MIEYLYNAIRATAGQEIIVCADITDEDGNLIKEDCHLTLFAPDREEKVSIIDGIYNSTDNEWNFTIPAEVTKELRGRYWYSISHAGKSLCFKEPIYFEQEVK